jgi:murein DD-endopeptidase MepM/ murein hydrolase activator NlpD
VFLAVLILASAACSRPRLQTEAATPRREATATAAATEPAGSVTLLTYLASRQLMVPVDGVRVAQVPNNFSAGRSGRAHNAHDIMAKRGTAVLSADDGEVLRLATNELGGITIYATDPATKLVYYYAHLDRYASGLKPGSALKRGEVIGYVGSSGNAVASAPHLHFQVAKLADVARHWEGEPIDARSYFALDGRKR